MIYITGDTHRSFDHIEDFCSRHNTTYNDVMIILGDAGINYYGGYRDRIVKGFISRIPITLFCIHGNHEMRPGNLPEYHLEYFHDGRVYVNSEFPDLLFAVDGAEYNFNSFRTLVIGGAYSVDKPYRLSRGLKWFEDEQPDQTIKSLIDAELSDQRIAPDIILTHTCPFRYLPMEAFLPGIDQSSIDQSTEQWLDIVEQKAPYKHWFCGHYHINKTVDKLHFLFDDIIPFPTRHQAEEK